MYDLRFTKKVDGLWSSVYGLQTQIARGFRSALTRFAEWCGTSGGKEEWAAAHRAGLSAITTCRRPFPPPPRQAPPFRSERNEQRNPKTAGRTSQKIDAARRVSTILNYQAARPRGSTLNSQLLTLNFFCIFAG